MIAMFGFMLVRLIHLMYINLLRQFSSHSLASVHDLSLDGDPGASYWDDCKKPEDFERKGIYLVDSDNMPLENPHRVSQRKMHLTTDDSATEMVD